MISFKQFLSENLAEDPIALIKRDCKPFLRARGNTNLYRGFNTTSSFLINVSPQMFKGAPRSNRRPTDSPPWLHTALDEMFAAESGIKFRSEGLFCTPDRETAEMYVNRTTATVGAVFPIGEFHYTWSPTITDAFHVFTGHFDFMFDPHSPLYDAFESELIRYAGDEFTEAPDTKNPVYEFMRTQGETAKQEIAENVIKNHGAQLYKIDSGLPQASKLGNEVVITCDRYYILTDAVLLSQL